MSENNNRDWLEQAHYSLLRSNGLAFALFMQRIGIEVSDRSVGGRFIACIELLKDGNVIMHFHGPTLAALSLSASIEVMKHEVLHFVNGHISKRGLALRETYGQAVANIAMDIVVNHHIDTELLASEGIPPQTAKKWGLPEGLSTTEYCLLLRDKVMDEELSQPLLVILKGYKGDAEAGGAADGAAAGGGAEGDGKGQAGGEAACDGEGQDDGEAKGKKVAGKIIPEGSWEVILSDLSKELLDVTIGKLVESAKAEAKARADSDDKDNAAGRGWSTADAKEFIEQLKRRAQIPWYNKLRQLEESKRNEDRIPSLVRPSRRHPLHFGRIRHHALTVWVGIDVSGSMGKAQLCVIDSELRAMQQRGAELMILQIDAELKSKLPYDRRTGVTEFKGRGGTDFSPFLEEVDKLPRHERPSFAVFYTDGYGCISRYTAGLKKRIGDAAYRKAIEGCPTKAPNGVEMLWLLAADSTTPEAFRKIVPFGAISVLPAPGKESKSA